MGNADRLPGNRKPEQEQPGDPREGMSAEIIDLASRTAYPAVTQRKTGSDGLTLAAGVGFIALIGAVTFWGMDVGRQAQDAVPAQEPVPQPSPAIAPVPAPQPGPVAAPPVAQPDPAPQPVLAASPEPLAAANPYSTPTVVFDASALPAPVPGTAAASGEGLTSAEGFASRLGGVGGGPAQAREMTNPQTTVTQGTMIPAILETAIDTDVPGYARAVVSQDVRSFDGTRILVPRSSRLIGQYQSGLQNGQKRAYVIWTRLIRPDGVSVDIASPATDFSGKTGLPGEVDSHFFKRFGSSMLLSVIGGLAASLSGGASVVLGGGGAAAAAATTDSQIGPTVRVRQGEPIRVYTARDLDFSRVPAN